MRPRWLVAALLAACAALSLSWLYAAEPGRPAGLPAPPAQTNQAAPARTNQANRPTPRPHPHDTATPTATSTPSPTPTSIPTATSTPVPSPTPTVPSGPAVLAGDVALRPEYAFVGDGSICEARSDVLDGGNEWRGDIPPSHFQSVSGLVYPTVGEVVLQREGAVYRIPIVAGVDGRLSYRVVEPLPGTYRLQAYLFYKHPLDAPGTYPRMYSMLHVDDQDVPSIAVAVPASGETRLDLRLKLTGNVCAP